MPAGCHVQIVPVWTGPTDVSDGGWHTTAVTPAGGRLPDRTASINPSHVFVMSALTLRTRRHPTRCRPPDIWKADAQRGVSRRGAASSRSVRVDGWVRTLWGTHLRKTIFQPTQNPRCQMQPLRQIQTALNQNLKRHVLAQVLLWQYLQLLDERLCRLLGNTQPLQR